MANLRNIFGTNLPLLLNRAVDRRVTLNELDPARRNVRVMTLQLVETMKADLLTQDLTVSVSTTWITESLTGTVDGSNKTYTSSKTPNPEAFTMVFRGITHEKVDSNPGQNQYTLSGKTITMGVAPPSGQRNPWARYEVSS